MTTDTATDPIDMLNNAERLAPTPDSRDATVEDWIRSYAALALAAHAAFQGALPPSGSKVAPGSRPDLGYLISIAVSSTAAAVALDTPREAVTEELWALTPEAGALNGEYIDWLTDTLDRLGINPADLDPAFEAADFKSPSRPA
jgi:hypothetical protein